MIYPLNPTLEVIDKLQAALDQAEVVVFGGQAEVEKLRKLLADPDVVEWRLNYRTVKAGGKGRRRAYKPSELRRGQCAGCHDTNRKVREGENGKLLCQKCA